MRIRLNEIRRVFGGLIVAIAIATIGMAVVRADWFENNPFGDMSDGGDVSIWVSWNRNPAVACAELGLDEDGDAYVAMWVDGGPGGAGEDRNAARTGAHDCWEEDKSPNSEWCGFVTGLANFYYINPQGYWFEIETWRAAETDTGFCS